MKMKLNNTTKDFDRKFPGIRIKITRTIKHDLDLILKIGLEYDSFCRAAEITSRIIQILEVE